MIFEMIYVRDGSLCILVHRKATWCDCISFVQVDLTSKQHCKLLFRWMYTTWEQQQPHISVRRGARQSMCPCWGTVDPFYPVTRPHLSFNPLHFFCCWKTDRLVYSIVLFHTLFLSKLTTLLMWNRWLSFQLHYNSASDSGKERDEAYISLPLLISTVVLPTLHALSVVPLEMIMAEQVSAIH